MTQIVGETRANEAKLRKAGGFKTYLKPISISLIIGASIVVSTFIYVNLQNQQREGPATYDLTSGEAESESEPSEEILDLKEEYFDDLDPVWGRIDEETEELIGEAFSSEYSFRSKPSPVVYLEIKEEQIDIEPVKRSEIKTEYFVEVIDQNYEEYGETIGGFFSGREEDIVSLEEADVDIDSEPERLITTANLGANHPPHNAYVVKNGKIILSVDFANGSVYPAKNGNGFYVKEAFYLDSAPMCCPYGNRIHRIIFENGKFVPVWRQDVYYLRFKEQVWDMF